MPLYQYSAVRKDGSHYQGTREAADRLTLFSELRKEAENLLSIKELHPGFSLKNTFQLFGRVSQSEKIRFVRNLSAIIQAGMPLSRGLAVLGRQTKNTKFKKIIDDIGEDIKKGLPLNTALKKFPKVFPPLLTAMVHAGEETGGLSKALNVVGVQMEKSYALGKRIKGALIYPAIVITVMVGIAILMMLYVVPTLAGTFKELKIELPTSTKAILFVSDFLVQHTITALGLILLMVIAVIAFARTKMGGRVLDYLFLRIPIIGTIVIETNAARTARTLSSLLSAGVSALPSIEITRDVLQNSYYKEVLEQASTLVGKGLPLSDAFLRHPKIFPILFSEMIAVGEETGQHSEMLLQVAEFYELEVEQKTKDISTVIEPFLMVLIGGGVGFFAVAMISPIYSISNGI